MARRILALLPFGFALGSVGCANTWDAMTSKAWRDAPFKRTFSSEDPMYVLRNKVEGDERAKAMRRLEEPASHGGSTAEQDEVLQILGDAATKEPSPVVRTAAIDALGRFKDPRVVRLLVAAYYQAEGQVGKAVNAPADPVQQVGLSRESLDVVGLNVPTGFPPVFIATIRMKAVAALAATKQPEAVSFLAEVATRKPDTPTDEPNRDIRIAAIRGLTAMRQKGCVEALAQVLAAEKGKDVAVVGTAHTGLVDLTGKQLPPDPDQWTKVAQGGVEIVPEPNMLQRVIHTATP
jgi:HEAT repeat protein